MERRRVLILPSWFPTEGSPLDGVFVEEQAAVLAEEFDVRVLVPKAQGWKSVLSGRTVRQSDQSSRSGLQVFTETAFSALPKWPSSPYRAYLRAATRGFQRIVADCGKPHLIHAHVVLPAGWVATKLGRKYSVPVVLTEHSSPFSIHLDSASRRRFVEETLRDIDCLIAVGPGLLREVQDFCPVRTSAVTGNLVRTRFFQPAERAVERRAECSFLSIGSLSKRKGLTHLLEAARILVNRGHQDFTLRIGGDGPELGLLEQQTQRLGLADVVTFLGSLDRSVVRDEMRRCDVFVLPSLRETFGIVLAEAMACGKPVIATRCGGPEYFVGPGNGLLVEPGDSAMLADAMECLKSSPGKYDPLSIRQAVGRRYGEAAFLENTRQVYDYVWQRAAAR